MLDTNEGSAAGAPVIIVVNARFMGSGAATIPYGAAGFVRTVLHLLRRSHSVALLLYRRTTRQPIPILRYHLRDGIRACEIKFDFASSLSMVRKAFSEATNELSIGHVGPPPILYHQSVVTLPFTPKGTRCLVTCHAPFVDSVLDVLGARLAEQAFEDTDGKIVALRELQHSGLEWLRGNPAAICVEMSTLQRRLLSLYGVPATQCRTAPPPVAEETDWPLTDLSQTARTWLSHAGSHTLLFSAAARIDGFKNLESLIDSTLLLHKAGLRPALYLAAATPQDESQRRRLVARLPPELAHYAFVEPRLPPTQLHTLFRRAAGQSVFVFPSRYETLGLTPLQALTHRVDVAVPDAPDRVGAAEYTPAGFRYEPGADGLAEKVAELSSRPSHPLMVKHDEYLPRGVFLSTLKQAISHAIAL